MLRVGNVYGPFSDWVRSSHGIEFISGRRRLDLSRLSVHQAYLDTSGLYVVAVTGARGTSRFLHAGEIRGRRLPSLWDWECVVHGPQSAKTEGTCSRCGKASFLTIIWRDRDAVSSLVGPVRIVRGRVMFAGRLFEPGEVLDLLMTKAGELYAKVLSFEVIEMDVPPNLMRADVSEIVWTPPRQVILDWR
ncbi:MAG: hypothetical protein QXP81_10020 [Nitrososphaerota archaeon]